MSNSFIQKFSFLIVSFFLFFIVSNSKAFAQINIPQINLPTLPNVEQILLDLQKTDHTSIDLQLETKTKSPLPGTEVFVYAGLLGEDAQKAQFRWTLDGKIIAQGLGITQISFISKPTIESVTNLVITASLPNRKSATKTIQFITADALITFQTKSFAPLEYRGALLPSKNTQVNITAFPLINNFYGPFTYKWFIDGKLYQTNADAQTISFLTQAGIGNSNNIKVEISNQSKSIKIIKEIKIPVVDPQIIFYQNNSLFNVVSEKTISAKERGGVIAKTYFFNQPSENLQFRWQFLQQRSEGTGEEAGTLQFVGPPQEQISYLRTTELNLEVINQKNISQQTNISLPIQFK